MVELFFNRVENIVGKKENADYQQCFSISNNFFQKPSSGSLTLYYTIPTFHDLEK